MTLGTLFGPDMKADLDALTSALRTRKDASLRWDSAIYPNETTIRWPARWNRPDNKAYACSNAAEEQSMIYYWNDLTRSLPRRIDALS